MYQLYRKSFVLKRGSSMQFSVLHLTYCKMHMHHVLTATCVLLSPMVVNRYVVPMYFSKAEGERFPEYHSSFDP